jgi:LysR family transcriptional regulator, transcriptional activator of nhaA
MEWLNYHHLLYFYTVVREGSIARASQQLRLAQPTISGQLRVLENSLGEKLFTRVGRNLVPTEMGQTVYRYAEEIFSLGRELQETVKGRPTGRPLRFSVGIADVLPKLIAYRLLAPAMQTGQDVRIVCLEDRPERLFAELSLHGLDLVLTDAPLAPTVKVRAYSHLLGESEVALYASPKLAAKLKRGFPKSINGVPIYLPVESTTLRRGLEQWFQAESLRPEVVGEFQDAALMKVFAATGSGLVPSTAVIEREVHRQFGLVPVGKVPRLRERFYAITVERKIKHPAVLAIAAGAKAMMG